MIKAMFRISSTLCLCAFVPMCLLLSSGCSKPAQNDNEKPAQRSIKQKTSVKKPEKKPFAYSSHGKRDIFVPLVSKDEGIISDKTKGIVVLKLPDLKVEGILFDKDSTPFVIINDRILTIGDSVNECEITSITANEIVLIYMNKEYSLKVDNGEISSKMLSPSQKKEQKKRLEAKSFLPSARENKSRDVALQRLYALEKQLAQTKEELDEYKASLSSEKKKAAGNVSTLQSRIKALESDKTDLKKKIAERPEERIIIKTRRIKKSE